MWHHADVPIGAPKDLITCRRFFLEATAPKQRQYEALRAYFVDGRSSREAATAFGYSVGSFRVLCHHFRRDPQPEFFVAAHRGPQTQPKKSAARDAVVDLRKQNYSVYEEGTGPDLESHRGARGSQGRGLRGAPPPAR